MKKILCALIPLMLLIGLSMPMLQKPKTIEAIHQEQIGHIPVLHNGRLKPLDSVARLSLILIHGKQKLRLKDKQLNATQWLVDVLTRAEIADQYPIFLIHNPDVKVFLGMRDLKKKMFSYAELMPHLAQIHAQSQQVGQYTKKLWSPYQRALISLKDHLMLYSRLKNTLFSEYLFLDANHVLEEDKSIMMSHVPGSDGNDLAQLQEKYEFSSRVALFAPIAPLEGQSSEPEDWLNTGHSFMNFMQTKLFHPGLSAYAQLLDQYNTQDWPSLNETLNELNQTSNSELRQAYQKARFEVLFNDFEPFYKSVVLYLLSFILIILSWLFWPKGLGRLAGNMLLLAFIIHTIGLISRMVLQGRPPVTNLYASAVFVGWIAIFVSQILEYFYKNRMGILTASAIGFTTLIIAHHLSLSGDTLEMMQAVLDSNFWLSTHVITVTMGYSGTFLAGFMGIAYILRGLFTTNFSAQEKQEAHSMVYGIVCFSLFFSFVGTALGGIWADQSWGRFWGWDPKENGALLIVLWNLIVLHSLKARVIQTRGLMVSVIFGNIVTSFSWFGVNMLGVGLHSYGFMDKAFFWLISFIVTQILFMALGSLPLKIWRSQ
ncbi:MAG: ABC-type transport system involved in cytochrome c biogenesis permease subunit [Candidatus Omnitrophota bacterium]|jgi:ABC-type transport system involved in cytochrome c biogenesis permease subunit